MIDLLYDNILVTELVKDSTAGVLRVNQDESSAYMFCKVEEISSVAFSKLKEYNNEITLEAFLNGDYLLVIRRTAKDPFIQDKFFISVQDVRAIITKEYFEGM